MKIGKKGIALWTALSLALLFLPHSVSAAPAAPSQDNAATASQEPVYDLNLVGYDELVGIKGIGSVLARRIIDYRTSIGAFTAVEELRQVQGIGEKSLASMRRHFTLAPPSSPTADSSPHPIP